MTNPNIDLPSKRAKLVLDIEKPLRRKFRCETEPSWWVIGILFIIVVILAFFVGSIVTNDQAHASYNAHKELCDTRLHDPVLRGTDAQQTLNKICN